MDNKFNNMVNKFLANTEAKDMDELNEKLQEFIQKYNDGEIEYENTILDDAYELLEKAENAKTKEQAIKYAKEAYEMCPDCFDAVLFQVDIEDNPIKRWKLLNEGLEIEKTRLENQGYFKKENIGIFYGIFETRPYIRGLYNKVDYLLLDGKVKQAQEVCKEILKLNENDNLGARYFLMAIYAYFEEENDMLKLYKKYPEEDLEMLFPLFVLYYKQGNDKKAKEYLNRINKVNPHLLKFYKGTMKKAKDIPEDHYALGDPSEVIMYLRTYYFLIDTIPTINYYILENSK
jgi:tetratricopeptide (TPR) repeat protein